MLSRGCHLVVFIVVIVLAPACRASPPCSPPPPGCRTWDPDAPVQVPMEVDLCVAGEASAVLAIQDHDSNTVCSLIVRATNSGVMLETRDGRKEVKDTQTVPDAALREDRLHLKIQYSSHDLRVLTRDDAALTDIPVDGTDSLRVALTQHDQSHDATICFAPTTRKDINGTQCCCECHLGHLTDPDNLLAAACVLLSVFVLSLTHYAVQPRPRPHAPAPARHTMGMNALRPQAPVEVDLCVAGEASVVLAIENHDGNDVGSLAVRATNSGVRLVAWKGRDVKDTQTVPDSALRGGRLHLKIQYSSHDLRVLTWDDAALMDIPVGGTDSLRVALTKQQPSHNATICSEPASSTTTQRSTTPPPLRNATTTGPATDQTSDAPKEEEEGEEEEMVVLLGVGTGLVGVAVTLSLAMLGLTLAFP